MTDQLRIVGGECSPADWGADDSTEGLSDRRGVLPRNTHHSAEALARISTRHLENRHGPATSPSILAEEASNQDTTLQATYLNVLDLHSQQ
jgi:hypothetical protein